MAWDVNEIVIDECFNDLFDISVGNDFNEDAWKGTIIVTENGEEVPLTCYIGCGGNAFNQEIVLDGNDDSTDQASTYCLNKQMCHLKLSKKEGKRTYNGPDRISLILHYPRYHRFRFKNSLISHRNIYQRAFYDNTIFKTRVYQSRYDGYESNKI